MTTTTTDRQRRANDMLMFMNPCLWPYYPFLAVRRQTDHYGSVERGVLYDARGFTGTYGHSCTVFRPLTVPCSQVDLLAGPRDVFDSFDELTNAGWTVH